MVYVTIPASPREHNISMEDVWFGGDDVKSYVITLNKSNTVTRVFDNVPNTIRRSTYRCTMQLSMFNDKYKDLIEADKTTLYHSFSIPKSSGGLRRIDAPKDELMCALRELKTILESNTFGGRSLYHTSAFAYIEHRSTLDCVKKHQQNESKWFGKFDVHNFFGSTTLEFVMHMFSMIYPFSEIMKTVLGAKALETALSLAFLNGVLPQGTPLSPMITNIMMIPIDHDMEKECRSRGLIYSRYADDFLISSRHGFMFKEVEQVITDTFKKFGAPFELNTRKTRYGSSFGCNWNFGVMLNKDNQITIGRKKKKQFESMLTAYAKDKKSGVRWPIDDVMHMNGLYAYYKMVEDDVIDRIVAHISNKNGVNIMACMKADLRGQ